MEEQPVVLGPYRLIEKIGAGGMGEVWKAEDTRLRRLVALKILPHAVSDNAESKARLIREARTAAQLYHPNIATIHSIEEAEGRSFIVMEFVEGKSLGAMLREGLLSEHEVARIARQVAEALQEAHARNIVHRDIKPDNIMVSGERVRVLDFGIAKQTGLHGAPMVTGATGIVTEAGMILGTIQYMSPEQALGKALDARSDLFSLGVVMYECLSGRLPFSGETVTETLTQIIRDTPKDITLLVPSLSVALAGVIRKCMAKNRDDRYPTARDLAADLASLSATDATARRAVPLSGDAPTVRTENVPTELRPRAREASKIWMWVALPLAVLAGIAIASLYRQRTQPTSPTQVQAAARPSPPPAAGTVMTVAPAPPPATAPVTESSASSGTSTEVTSSAPVTPSESHSSPPPIPVVDRHQEALDLYQKGLRAVEERKPLVATIAFVAAAEKDPDFAKAWLKVAQLALRAGNKGEAEHAYQQALRNRDTLQPRDQELAEIGLAAARGDLAHAGQLIDQFEIAHPGDEEIRPYAKAIRAEERFGGETHRPGGRRRGHRID